ncbi:hypothetical protein [Saccharothrix hoggarensis]|uniref:Uncharacterized protein n=1 Tax=Saccharothrix hoggarensis TaxID=913853 RepID=A0ABW3QNC7_9PSEU
MRLTRLTPADREELAEAWWRADDDTLFQRFCGAAPPVTPALLAHLTDLDHVRRCAIAARDATGRGVAIARYEATGEPGAASGNVSTTREEVSRCDRGKRTPGPYWRAWLGRVPGTSQQELEQAAAIARRTRRNR